MKVLESFIAFIIALLKANQPAPVKACPTCGISLEDVAKLGKLGCADCWHYFDAELRHLASQLHGSTHHAGKKLKSKEARILSYKKKMAKAIEIENYEAAGELKKLIEELESSPTPPWDQ